MKLTVKFSSVVGLLGALACLSQGQTLQWSTALPAVAPGGKLLLGGTELYITSQLGDQESTATLYQASESGSLTGSLVLSASSFGATTIDIQDATTDSAGNVYILLGCAGGSAGQSNFSVVKVSPSLSQVWATSFVSGASVPVQIQLGSSNNPFVLAYYAYGQTYSFASDGTLNAGQPFQFLIPQSSFVKNLAVINANGSYPDEPYVSGLGVNPSNSVVSGFMVCLLFSVNPLWCPNVGWTGSGTSSYTSGTYITTLLTDNKYVYMAGVATFNYPSATQYEEPFWSFCGSDGNFPTSGIWNRTFIGANYTLTPSLSGPVYEVEPNRMAIDNEHDVLYGGELTAMNATNQNACMFVTCQTDITGIGKSPQMIRADSVGLTSYPTFCVGVGACPGKGVAWALGGNGTNGLFKFIDNATTFAFAGAASPPVTAPIDGDPDYYGLAINPSSGEAYVLANGYLSGYK